MAESIPSDLADETLSATASWTCSLVECCWPNCNLCVRIEPNSGQAVNPGEIGYAVAMENDHCTDMDHRLRPARARGDHGRNALDHEPPTNAKLGPHSL